MGPQLEATATSVRLHGGPGCHGTCRMATDPSLARERAPRLGLSPSHTPCLVLGQSPGIWAQRRGVLKIPPASAVDIADFPSAVVPKITSLLP